MTGAIAGVLPVLGARTPSLPGLAFRDTSTSSSSATSYAMSTNVFNTGYTVAGEVTYSETDLRALFGNAAALTSVARLITGYGVSGQNRAIQFESMVKPAQSQNMGIRPSLTQGTTATGLTAGTNDVCYSSSLGIFVNAVQVSTAPPTWGAGDKIGIIYRPALGTVDFYLNGANVYTVTGISGDYTPACQGVSANTHEIRVNTSWSYTLPGDVLYWR